MSSEAITRNDLKAILDEVLMARLPVDDYVVEHGTNGIWTYRKWNSGIAECWGKTAVPSHTYAANGGANAVEETLPMTLFTIEKPVVHTNGNITAVIYSGTEYNTAYDYNRVGTWLVNRHTSAVTNTGEVFWDLKGRWK